MRLAALVDLLGPSTRRELLPRPETALQRINGRSHRQLVRIPSRMPAAPEPPAPEKGYRTAGAPAFPVIVMIVSL
jgi:hypothetical protein